MYIRVLERFLRVFGCKFLFLPVFGAFGGLYLDPGWYILTTLSSCIGSMIGAGSICTFL